MSNLQWIRATTRNRCPICNAVKLCTWAQTEDNELLVQCQSNLPSVDGYKLVKVDGGMGCSIYKSLGSDHGVAYTRPPRSTSESDTKYRRMQRARARDLFDRAILLGDTLSERALAYLEHRKLDAIRQTVAQQPDWFANIRFDPKCPYRPTGPPGDWPKDSKGNADYQPVPAILCRNVNPDGSFRSIQRIYLDPNHERKRLPGYDGKKLLGQAGAIVCRLGPPLDGEHALVCEGVETGLALLLATELSVLCCISTDGIEKIDLSGLARRPTRVTVCADNDAMTTKPPKRYPGEHSARISCERLGAVIDDVRIAMPPVPDGVELTRSPGKGVKSIDWLDIYVLPEFGAAHVRDLVQNAEDPRAYRWHRPAGKQQGSGGSSWRVHTTVTDTGMPVISTDPNLQADAYIEHNWMLDDDGALMLRRWQGQWYGFAINRYVELSVEHLSTRLRSWLAGCAMRKPKKGASDLTIPENWEEVRIRSTKRMAADIEHAVIGGTLLGGGLEGQIDPYSWVNGSGNKIDGRIPAADVVSAKNGLVDTGAWCRGERRILAHTPDWFSQTSLPFAVPEWARPGNDDEAWRRAPAYLDWVSNAFDEDPHDLREGGVSQIDILHQWCGLLFTPDTSFQTVVCVQGLPLSGKGTLNRLVYFMMGGKEQVASTTLFDLSERFGKEPLVGKLLAVIPDAQNVYGKNAASSAEVIKMISGEDAVGVDRKTVRAIPSINLVCRFMIYMNEILRLPDETRALERRFIWLCTPNQVEPKDIVAGLDGILQGEADAIGVLWLNGLSRLRAKGRFLQPTRGLGLAKEFSLQSSRVRLFVEECCCLEPKSSEGKDDLYDVYIAWCNDVGERRPLAKNEFCKRIINAGLGVESTTAQKSHRFKGIYITPDALNRYPDLPAPHAY